LYNRGAILATETIFSNLVTSGMLWAADGVDSLDVKVRAFFSEMRAKIRFMQQQ